MTSLLDIAPPEIATANVAIKRGDTIQILTVKGLSSLDLARLMKRFPEFRKLAAPGAASDGELAEMGMETVPVVIAMGLGTPDEDTERLVGERLSIEEQAELVTAIMELTNPPRAGGPLAKADESKSAEESGKDQAGNSP